MMNKSELVGILQRLIVTWTTQYFEPGVDPNSIPESTADNEYPDPPLPIKETQHIYTLLSDVIPAGVNVEQVDDERTLMVYDLIFDEVKAVDLHHPYYFGLEVNGTIDPEFSVGMILRNEELPDLTSHRNMMMEKVDKFKHKFKTLLNVCVEEWKQMPVEDLAFVCESEYNITVSDEDMYGVDAVGRIISLLKDGFIQQTLHGSITAAEHKDTVMKNTVKSLNVVVDDWDDISDEVMENIRSKWLDIIRKYRNNALASLDEEEKLAIAEDDQLGIEEIGVIKQMLKDLPADVDYLKDKTTVKSIIDFWPALLLPRPEKIEVVENVSS